MRAGKRVMVVLAVVGFVWSTAALAQRGGAVVGAGVVAVAVGTVAVVAVAVAGTVAADTGAAWVVPHTTLRAAVPGVRRRSHPMAERWPHGQVLPHGRALPHGPRPLPAARVRWWEPMEARARRVPSRVHTPRKRVRRSITGWPALEAPPREAFRAAGTSVASR